MRSMRGDANSSKHPRLADGLQRRDFLKAVAGIAVAGTAAPLLASCTRTPQNTAENNAKVKLPTYQAKVLVKADFPELSDGTPAAYLKYPKSPPKAYDGTPAKGGTITVLKDETGTPPALAQNPFWQELNRQVGAQIEISSFAGDYQSKLATVVAGGDLPDMIQITTGQTPNLASLLAKDFQDLSPWLGGDAAKKYSSLAGLPTQAWKNVTYNGGLYGIPWPLGVPGAVTDIRQDIVENLGLSVDIKNGQDFLKLCAELTDAKAQRWAVDVIATAQPLVSEMVGVPNQWRVKGGKFTSQYETEEFKQMLSIVTQMWKAGYIYPGSLASSAGQAQWFQSGKTTMLRGGYTNWSVNTGAGRELNPKFKIGGLVTPKWDGGGQAGHYAGSGMYTMTALKKASKPRIQELLRVLDWFATPFGGDGYLFRHWGISGRDYTLDGTDPVETKVGVTECQDMVVSYIASAPLPIYIPGDPVTAKTQYSYLKQLMKVSVPLPTVGLFSNTDTTQGAILDKNMNSLIKDIVVGRQPLSAWTDGVASWRSGGGDTIRQEYEKSYQKVGPLS